MLEAALSKSALLCWTHRCTATGSGSSISHWLGNRFQGSTWTDWVTRGSRSTVACKTGPRKPHKLGKLAGSWVYTVYCPYKYQTKSKLSFPDSSPDKPGRIRCILAGQEELCFAAKGEAVFLENPAPSTGKWHRIPAQAPKPGLWKQTHFLCLNRVPASLAPSSPACQRQPLQVLQPSGVTLPLATLCLEIWRKNTARTKLVITSAFLVSGSGEFSRANTSGSHFEEECRVSEASVFQALQKRSALHICTDIPAAYVSHFLEGLDEQEIRL